MLQIPKILMPSLPLGEGRAAGSPLRACDVPQLMLTHGVPYHRVATLNWPDAYPYQPQVEVALAHTGSCLLLHYRVSEQCLRAVAEADGGRVWEDSCCELFLQPLSPAVGGSDGAAKAPPYYNIECNCAGTLLIAAGEDRHDRRPAPAEVLAGVDRWSSLGRDVIPLTEGPAQWHMALVVPVGTFFESGLTDLTGLHMRGNAYKCGDCLKEPHFLSLFPIATERPDFHRPEFFRDITFGK